ncbi:hypothetical protein SLEP1_g25067 [Rubroshorea leprosula]|uniref:Uncharacterized protein n=1 Tax=Rubroshorea leprosula TaxID=152421 RepID=A0AAV5JT93_9ROSI|nr:hypothetical protein SLEP1_g25067 [Rubroshorea leprosula]
MKTISREGNCWQFKHFIYHLTYIRSSSLVPDFDDAAVPRALYDLLSAFPIISP